MCACVCEGESVYPHCVMSVRIVAMGELVFAAGGFENHSLYPVVKELRHFLPVFSFGQNRLLMATDKQPEPKREKSLACHAA